jgi:hypothetical protein
MVLVPDSMLSETSRVLIIIQALFVIGGVILALINFKADHERRKKQATIDFCHKIEGELYPLLEQINAKFQDDRVVNVCDVNSKDKDKDKEILLDTIKKYLASMEMLAVGINTGIHDIAVFDRMAGNFAIRIFYRFREIILFLRGPNNTHRYADFERLVLELEKLRNKRFPKQDKDFAKMKHGT